MTSRIKYEVLSLAFKALLSDTLVCTSIDSILLLSLNIPARLSHLLSIYNIYVLFLCLFTGCLLSSLAPLTQGLLPTRALSISSVLSRSDYFVFTSYGEPSVIPRLPNSKAVSLQKAATSGSRYSVWPYPLKLQFKSPHLYVYLQQLDRRHSSK